jgi:hypothetical protein
LTFNRKGIRRVRAAFGKRCQILTSRSLDYIFIIIIIIIWGTRAARSKLGFVAEECPSCGKPTVCSLLEVSQGGHIFFIPTGKGKFPLAHEARCMDCSRQFQVDASTYHDIGKNKRMCLMELVSLTSPWLVPMTPPQQAAEIRSRNVLAPFVRYDLSFRDRIRRGARYDWISFLGLLLFLGGPVLSMWLSFTGKLPFLTRSQAIMAGSIGSVVSASAGIYMIANETGRFFRRQLIPKILYELGPMAVTREEWEAVAHRMKRLRFPTWRMVKSELSRVGQESHTAAVSKAAPPKGSKPALNLNFNR